MDKSQDKKYKSISSQELKNFEKKHKHTFRTSMQWALHGIYYTIRTQRNFKIQLTITIIVLVLSYLFRISLKELSTIIFCISSVLFGEMVNTSIEFMVDLYENKYNMLAKLVKDIAAGSVLILALNAIIQGSIIFIPKIIPFIKVLF